MSVRRPTPTSWRVSGGGPPPEKFHETWDNLGYTPTRQLQSQSDAAIDGLSQEDVELGFDPFGEAISLNTTGDTPFDLVYAVGYDEFGKPLQYTLNGSAGSDVWIAMTYDPHTQALTDIQTSDASTPTGQPVIDDTSYTYTGNGVSPGAGLVTSTTDTQSGVADTQCFTYDYAQRLSQAWTATDACSTTPTPGNSPTVGGPTPYWQSWTYDPAGDRATQNDHDTTGNTTNDTTTTYTYPTPDSATDQPHTLTNTTATGPNAAADTASYTYDPDGNTTGMTGGATGKQTLTWNDQNQLATDTTTSGTTTYIYDAEGNLIVRRDPGQTTFFFGDEQLVLNTTTNTTTATRYYSINGTVIAERSPALQPNPQFLIPNRQGTDQLTITNDTTQTVTRRQFLPFGQPRGSAPTTWPGDQGYVGGTPDPTTTLENLGAREYNPTTGRFLSPDPVFESGDPAQMAGYDYAGNNPVTNEDPTGVCPVDRCGYGISNNGHIATTGPADPQNPNAGSYRNGNFVPAPARQPTQRKVQPVRHANTAGGKAAGEMAPNYYPAPSAGPPAAEVGGVAFLNLLVLAGNLFGDEEIDASTLEFDKRLWDSAESQIRQDEGQGSDEIIVCDR